MIHLDCDITCFITSVFFFFFFIGYWHLNGWFSSWSGHGHGLSAVMTASTVWETLWCAGLLANRQLLAGNYTFFCLFSYFSTHTHIIRNWKIKIPEILTREHRKALSTKGTLKSKSNNVLSHKVWCTEAWQMCIWEKDEQMSVWGSRF